MLSPVNGQDDGVVLSRAEVYGVGKPIEHGAPRFSSHAAELHRVVGDSIDRFVQRCAEPGAKATAPTFVPVSRLECFGFSLGSKADAPIHSRSSSFRRTSSQGMED